MEVLPGSEPRTDRQPHFYASRVPETTRQENQRVGVSLAAAPPADVNPSDVSFGREPCLRAQRLNRADLSNEVAA
jgi:hypothetical protein